MLNKSKSPCVLPRTKVRDLSNTLTLTNKERGYLIGLFEGDGYKIYDKKSRHYQIEFYLNSVKDKMTISYILYLLRKLNLNPNIFKDKRYNCIRVRVYSKDLFHLIGKNYIIDKENKEFKIGFLSGVIDSEGYVNFKKSMIEIINTNENLVKSCMAILGELNIDATLKKRKKSRYDKKDSYRIYVSVNFKKSNHVSIKAGYRPYVSDIAG